jgi:nucleoside-triphosphatase THEP1
MTPLRLALVADRRVGKTTTLLALADALREAGIPFTGVVQPADVPEGRPMAYALEDVVTGERHPLARRDPASGAFQFDDQGWAWAVARIVRPAPVLLVDELGLREADGRGHLPAVAQALGAATLRAAVLAVRRECLPALTGHLGALEPIALDLTRRGPEVVSALLSLIKEALT